VISSRGVHGVGVSLLDVIDLLYVVGTALFFALMVHLVTTLDSLGHDERNDRRES
jgi:hypothetical protein